ncbi:unnamed protein product [Sphenostylis stenocarpa]|uniref:Protein kinase domain-containing protein n=1 Tax=Sphenostylis stenocarpa TaxID=92480 RepID=A0AA86W2H7_9FABA|nr:unnamed protein product [Sphenostylis stenocarpa]
MAPEYIMQGQFSVKSDVFSFGVLLLEIVSGQKNSGIRLGENVEDLLSFVSVTFSIYIIFFRRAYAPEHWWNQPLNNKVLQTWRNWREGTAVNILDPSLNNNSRSEMMRCIHIGLLCVQENLTDRPTMATIMLMLNSESISLPIPSEPAFYVNSTTRSLPAALSWGHSSTATRSTESTIKYSQESENEASITQPYPR